MTSQNSTYSKKFPADFDFLCTRRRQIDSRRGVPSFMSIYSNTWRSYSGKTEGGGVGSDPPPTPPPRRWRVKALGPRKVRPYSTVFEWSKGFGAPGDVTVKAAAGWWTGAEMSPRLTHKLGKLEGGAKRRSKALVLFFFYYGEFSKWLKHFLTL